MTIMPRTCANCAAFNSIRTGADPSCLQLVTIAEPTEARPRAKRQPESADCCGRHMTHDEFNRYGGNA